jgi:subtilisin
MPLCRGAWQWRLALQAETSQSSDASIGGVGERAIAGELPAWSIDREALLAEPLYSAWAMDDARGWAWGGSTGAGVRVCIVDSGVDASHPAVGLVASAVAVSEAEDGTLAVHDDAEGDLFGHGTACAGIVRKLAPDCEIHSVRVLGGDLTGSGQVLVRGLRWAIEQGFEVINLSMSTTKSKFSADLRELTDLAYFRGAVVVASAHNMPVESFPWRFSAVVSVGSHSGADPLEYYANPRPPVEFAAPGVDIELAWLDGATIRATGNSFATPHIAGIAALVLSKHPGMRPFELKAALRAAGSNVRSAE